MEKVIKRFKFNIKRVENLTKIYSALSEKRIQGIQYREDILRAAVVMLHAAMEDLLRGVLKKHLINANPEYLKDIPFDIKDRKTVKIGLSELTKYRRKKVDSLVQKSISDYLDHQSFNTREDLIRNIEALKLSKDNFELGKIEKIMKRRHSIVHQSDRNQPDGLSHGKPSPLLEADVREWIKVMSDFGDTLIENLTS